jgi:hypothetical protein
MEHERNHTDQASDFVIWVIVGLALFAAGVTAVLLYRWIA